MLHADLLQQANELALRDPTRPKQANLRRAISAAYYSLFHLLTDQACRNVMGSRHEQAAYRHVLGRAFSHSTMKAACVAFAGGTLKATVAKGLPATFSIHPTITRVASVFVDLQQRRHLADYDVSERHARPDVMNLIGQVEKVSADFIALPNCDERSFFLACLLTWDSLSKR
jgi:hypothetical protein